MVRNLIAERLGGVRFGQDTELYKFAKIKQAKIDAEIANPGRNIIDVGIGEPDTPAPPEIVNVLAEEAGKPENRFYSDNGIEEFQIAASAYLKTVYGLEIERPTERIIHGIGSKPILAMLPMCFINPGDVLVATVPGYGVTSTYTRYMGGEEYPIPLLMSQKFLPDLESIPADIRSRGKLIYVNYPNNPTGRSATVEFYKQLVEFAYRYEFIIISDLAYGSLTYGDTHPLCVHNIDGADDVCVEVFSLSKAFNMTGWRIAFALGSPIAMNAYGTVKNNTDCGQFRGIQKAGTYALNHPEITDRIRERYSRRFDMLVPALRRIGFDAEKPDGTFYLYAPIPKGTGSGTVFTSAMSFAEFLIRECGISAVPWDDAGSYIRFSITFEAASVSEERVVIADLEERLAAADLRF